MITVKNICLETTEALRSVPALSRLFELLERETAKVIGINDTTLQISNGLDGDARELLVFEGTSRGMKNIVQVARWYVLASANTEGA